MTIRSKIIGISSLSLIALIIVFYSFAVPSLLKGFTTIENEDAQQNIGRVTDAVKYESESLGNKLADWSSWDDTYKFVKDKNQEYIVSNFADDPAYDSPIFDMILFYDNAGNLVYSNGKEQMPDKLKSILKPDSVLLRFSNQKEIDSEGVEYGFVIVPDGLLLVASKPILPSSQDKMSRGTLLFTKYLTEEYRQSLEKRLNLDFDLYITSKENLPQDIVQVKNNLMREKIVINTFGDKIAAYTSIKDIEGNDSVLAKVSLERNIYEKGTETVRTFIVITLIAIGVSAIVTSLVIELVIVRRLTYLSRWLALITNKDGYDKRVRLSGSDELSSLSVTVNTMLDRIKESSEKEAVLMDQLKKEKDSVEKIVIERTKELQVEQSRFLLSINSLPLGFIITDVDNKMLLINLSMTRILLTGPTILIDGSKKIDLKQAIEDQSKKTAVTKALVSSSLDTVQGKVYQLVTVPVLSSTNEVEGTVVLVDDITEAKIQERSKDEFFSIASHELRTPLTSIKGNSSMILDFYKAQMKDPNLKEMVEDVHTSSVRLISIVNDFLDVSRLEQGKVSFECSETNLNEVIETVATEMKTVLDDKSITLTLDKSTLGKMPPVWADKNRLQQVVYNLIGNAAKFTEGGTITLSAEVDKSASNVKIKVIDTGRGMTAESQQLLFRKFQQASSSLLTRDTTKGTGLGLYISKMIVEGMGGSIALEESAEGKGSTFSFTIPLADKDTNKVTVKTKTDAATGLTERV